MKSEKSKANQNISMIASGGSGTTDVSPDRFRQKPNLILGRQSTDHGQIASPEEKSPVILRGILDLKSLNKYDQGRQQHITANTA